MRVLTPLLIAAVAVVSAQQQPPPNPTFRATVDLVNFGRVHSLPAIIAGLMAVVASAMLGHTLVTSVRRRRRDLAILKTLGFQRHQVTTTVV